MGAVRAPATRLFGSDRGALPTRRHRAGVAAGGDAAIAGNGGTASDSGAPKDGSASVEVRGGNSGGTAHGGFGGTGGDLADGGGGVGGDGGGEVEMTETDSGWYEVDNDDGDSQSW